MRVHELLADSLAASGVTHVFTVMGDGNLDLLDAVARRGVALVHARHEQGAVAMADGYARASGRLGVCSVTWGAGLTQTATSLATARAYGSPVLLIAGDAPVADPDRAERFDQLSFGRLAAGTSLALLSARGAPATLQRVAARLADGPVVLNAPTDVQGEAVDVPSLPRLIPPPRPEPGPPAPAAVERAAAALAGARRPAILAGRGATGAGEALAALADRLGAPIATTLLAHGLCAKHPRHVGISGSLGDGRGTRTIQEADCVYAVGTALTPWTSGGRPLEARVVRVDADPRRLDGGAEGVAVAGDARLATEALLSQLGASPPALTELPPPRHEPDVFVDGAGTVDPRRAMLALDRALPARRRLVIDAGHFAIYTSQLLTVSRPEEYIFTSNIGAVGQGLATAIGAAVAAPEPRTTLVAGDGGFLMAVAELETAARYHVPLTMFVMDDDGYGQERHSMRERGLDAAHAHLPSPDLAALARATGAAGARIDSVGGLDGLERTLRAADGPLVLQVRINGEVVSPSSAEVAAALRGER